MSKLPVYELKFALEGLVDVHRDPLPAITHVEFEREHLIATDIQAIMHIAGSSKALAEDEAVHIDCVVELLGTMTNLTPEHVKILHARDFMNLLELVSPFLQF